MAIRRLAINGKFLSARPTGVHRVAAELATAIARIAKDRGDIEVELWKPRNTRASAPAIPMPGHVVKPFTGIPWEQIAIIFRDPNRLLLNLCNLGPVLRGNAVTMIHDCQVYQTPASYSWLFRIWYKTIQPLIGMRHRGILTVSHYSREAIIAAGICSADRIFVVYNGVDHMARVAPDREILASMNLAGRPYVVALASLHDHKNIRILASAFKNPALKDVALVLVGDSSAADFARAGIEVPPPVQFSGRVSDGALRALYEGAICVAFPSRTEGFGLPPLEAMLLGCPAIVAPRGALPEICGDAVVYADPDKAEDWVAAILKMARDRPHRDHYSALGRDRASRFTWRAAACQLLDALDCLCAARTISRPAHHPAEGV